MLWLRVEQGSLGDVWVESREHRQGDYMGVEVGLEPKCSCWPSDRAVSEA
jgi:hypothetical protein